MSRIVVITHEFDQFVERRLPFWTKKSRYLLFDVLREMEKRGHSVHVLTGIQHQAQGDLAILHVDCSVIPQEYLDFARSFPKTVNARVADITKRKVSGALLSRGDDWTGPVIVKSNLNYGGNPEADHNEAARRRGRPPPHPEARNFKDYEIFDSTEAMPERYWDDPELVVERFIPERESDGVATRTWLFVGARERCMRHVSHQEILKGAHVVRSEMVAVPEEMRKIRRRLGFDLGKFDFVIHDGRAVLLDANKTPGIARSLRPMQAKGAPALADGLEAMLS